jgi:UDP-3-O-[3-hydroxymyristoyl] glucosamine N-acyltransferase
MFHPSPKHPGGIREGAFVNPKAHVHESACVMSGASVSAKACVGARTVLYPGAFVGENAAIGKDCILYPNAVVMTDCVLGDRVILQPGAVIGGDGFGFAPDAGTYLKIPQVGNVVLEDDVEIGANSTVDRAAMGTTFVGCGTKIDNLVMVAHNCQIGQHTIIVSQVGISGSTKVGDHCVLGGQVGVAGHLTIADKVTLAAKAGVMADIPESGVYWGSPSGPMKDEMRRAAAYKELPEMLKRLRRMEKALLTLDPTFNTDDPKKEKP